MVGKLHLLLAAACVVAVLGNEGKFGCVYARWGRENDRPSPLNRRIVGPGDADLDYTSEIGFGCTVVGAKASMCPPYLGAGSNDAGNTISFKDKLIVHTHRNLGKGGVLTTVYCEPCLPLLGGCLKPEELKKPVARATQQVKAECPPSGC